MSGERANRVRAVLEAERRTTIFSHTQIDECMGGKWGELKSENRKEYELKTRELKDEVKVLI